MSRFSKTRYSTELADQQAAEAAAGDSKKAARIKIRTGSNVFWWIPSTDQGTAAKKFEDAKVNPIRYMQVHYNPFHLCGRADAQEYIDEEGNIALKKDNWFANCPRCETAWGIFEDSGRAKEGDSYDVFRNNMSDLKGLVQFIDFTPFFSTKGAIAKPVKKLIDEHMADFMEIMKASSLGEETEQPEDMPDDIYQAALASPGTLFLNETTSKALSQKHREKTEEEEESPLYDPSQYLLQIRRSTGSQKFKGADGKERSSFENTPSFIKAKSFPFPMDLLDDDSWIWDCYVNIHNLEDEEHEELEARAKAMHKLDRDEIIEYLESQNHSYAVEGVASAEEGVEEEEEDEQFNQDMSDPSSMTKSKNLFRRGGRPKSLQADMMADEDE